MKVSAEKIASPVGTAGALLARVEPLWWLLVAVALHSSFLLEAMSVALLGLAEM